LMAKPPDPRQKWTRGRGVFGVSGLEMRLEAGLFA